jgi:hypothetical protein
MRGLRIFGLVAALMIGAAVAMPASAANSWGTLVYAGFSCQYGKVTVTLQWTGNSPYATGQWVEMSYTDNGWQPHTTTSVGPLKPKINTFSSDGLLPNTRHFLRFNQQFADGSFDPSLTFRFDTPGCTSDGFSVVNNTMGQLGDYDCEGGEGDGPNYVQGPVTVNPFDPYQLDADRDGTGCEEESSEEG